MLNTPSKSRRAAAGGPQRRATQWIQQDAEETFFNFIPACRTTFAQKNSLVEPPPGKKHLVLVGADFPQPCNCDSPSSTCEGLFPLHAMPCSSGTQTPAGAIICAGGGRAGRAAGWPALLHPGTPPLAGPVPQAAVAQEQAVQVGQEGPRQERHCGSVANPREPSPTRRSSLSQFPTSKMAVGASIRPPPRQSKALTRTASHPPNKGGTVMVPRGGLAGVLGVGAEAVHPQQEEGVVVRRPGVGEDGAACRPPAGGGGYRSHHSEIGKSSLLSSRP